MYLILVFVQANFFCSEQVALCILISYSKDEIVVAVVVPTI